MFLKNSFASDFMTRPTRGLSWARAPGAEATASKAMAAAASVVRRIAVKLIACLLVDIPQTFARTFAIGAMTNRGVNLGFVRGHFRIAIHLDGTRMAPCQPEAQSPLPPASR